MHPPCGTYADAINKLNLFIPRAGERYTLERSYDLGPKEHQNVSGLSPYLARRVLLPQEIIHTVLQHHNKENCAKFCQEVYWQTYWKGWLEMRPQVWEDAKNISPIEDASFTQACNGNTGIDAFDFWVNELKSTGYLHNHSRMWFASIWIYTLELPWKLGAKFFFDFLCDADSASNTLSWRWVAGLHTNGKAYLASKENIKKYTKGRFEANGLATKVKKITDTLKNQEITVDPTVKNTNYISDLWIIFPDDYSIHRYFDLKHTKVIIIHPDTAYNWQSKVVTTFNLNLVNDLYNYIPHSMIITHIKEIFSYLNTENINSISLMKPHIGIYHDLYLQILAQIPSDIKLNLLRRKWDNTFFSTATKGFFAFKKTNKIL